MAIEPNDLGAELYGGVIQILARHGLTLAGECEVELQLYLLHRAESLVPAPPASDRPADGIKESTIPEYMIAGRVKPT